MSKCKTYIAASFLAACFFMTTPSAFASPVSMTGSISLGYADYEANRSGSEDDVADAFYQKYSINASKRGSLYNKKGGAYKLAINYNNLQYLTNINDMEYSPSSSFLGWDGEIRFNLPYFYGFDLNLFSYSKRRDSYIFQSDIVGSLTSGLVVDLYTIDSKGKGFTFKLGTNGGPYYHLYGNRYESKYEDSSTSDIGRVGMGIQYGVNWLHYFQDKSNSHNYKGKTFIVGNVELRSNTARLLDNRSGASLAINRPMSVSYYLDSSSQASEQKRLWYMLTNWLYVSADFYYSEEEMDREEISTKRMTVALRGELDRSSIGTFSVHERKDSDTSNKKLLQIPFWADYRLSPATTINFANDYSHSETEDLLTNSVYKSKSLKDSLFLTSRIRNRFLLETGYDIRKSENPDQEKEGHSVYVDLFSKRTAGIDYIMKYKYDTDKIINAILINDRKTAAHTIIGSVSYGFTKQSTLNLRQSFLTSHTDEGLLSTGYKRFTTGASIDYYSLRGARSNIDLTRDESKSEDGNGEIQYVASGSYNSLINNRLKLAVDLKYTENQLDYEGNKTEATTFSLANELDYKLERNLRSLTSIETGKSTSRDKIDSSSLRLGETLEYSYNRKGFSRRKWFDLYGTALYTKREVGGSKDDYTTLSMNVNYYLSRVITCGAGFSTSRYNIGKNLYFALRYPLMSLTGSYRQQIRELAGTEESIYRVDFSKRF